MSAANEGLTNRFFKRGNNISGKKQRVAGANMDSF